MEAVVCDTDAAAATSAIRIRFMVSGISCFNKAFRLSYNRMAIQMIVRQQRLIVPARTCKAVFEAYAQHTGRNLARDDFANRAAQSADDTVVFRRYNALCLPRCLENGLAI